MIFGSVCSGMEMASLAWVPLGWRCAFMSEIEPFARAILKHRWPETPLHGDFTTIEAGDYEPIDLLVGGTPCQSFSVAGLRGGMADERGNLALEYLRLADRLRPRWLVWENVPGLFSSRPGATPEEDEGGDDGPVLGAGSDFAAFLSGLVRWDVEVPVGGWRNSGIVSPGPVDGAYGVAWRVLDAQYFGVAQRRRRVFVVGHLGDWRRAAAVLFERQSLSGDPAPSRAPGKNPTGTLASRAGGGGWPDGGDGRHDHFRTRNVMAFSSKDHGADAEEDLSPTLRAGVHNKSHANAGVPPAVAFAMRGREGGAMPEVHDQVSALRAASGGSTRDMIAFDPTQITHPENRSNPKPGDPVHSLAQGQAPPAIAGAAVRRLTPEECEALMGAPRFYTLVPWRKGLAPDGPRYRVLGNSFVRQVVLWIGQRIQAVEDL